MLEEGTRIPDVTLRRLTARGIEQVSTGALFAGRRAILFGVPGAFTPTCSDEHLPGYVRRAAELRARGVETIACVAVNDPYVMDAWGRSQGAGDAVLLLSDGNGDLTRALGLEHDFSASGMGRRCRRFATLLEDGWFRWVAVEPARGITVCGAEHLLDRLARAGVLR
jgi:peroxiredoxin